jgi:hypothetical protein
MEPTFNKQTLFYDYFNHIPPLRMSTEFGLGYLEQSAIKYEIQHAIKRIYDRLVDNHDLKHFNVYQEVGEEFDEDFYDELKREVYRYRHDMDHWAFLDMLMTKYTIDDPMQRAFFKSIVTIETGDDAPQSFQTDNVDLKESLIALINRDLDPLSGEELLYLTKIE